MLTYYGICATLLAAAYGLYRLWRRGIDADLREGAGVEYERLRRTDPDLLKDMAPDAFADVYMRTEVPRFPAYALATAALFLGATPLVLGLFNGLAVLMLDSGVVPASQETATSLYLNADGASVLRKTDPETIAYVLEGWAGFYLFFVMLGFWLSVLAIMMRRYHGRTPGTLREEILRARTV